MSTQPRLVSIAPELLDAFDKAIGDLQAAREALRAAYLNEPYDGPIQVHEARAVRDLAERTVQERVADLLHPGAREREAKEGKQ